MSSAPNAVVIVAEIVPVGIDVPVIVAAHCTVVLGSLLVSDQTCVEREEDRIDPAEVALLCVVLMAVRIDFVVGVEASTAVDSVHTDFVVG